MAKPFEEYRFHSFSGGIKTRKPGPVMDLGELVEAIRGPQYAADIESLRRLDPDAAKLFKQDLDYVTISGTFNPTRQAKNLYKHSGLLVLDFDHLPDVDAARLQLQSDQYCLVCFVSPSGTGLKWICELAQPDRHLEAFADIGAYIKQTYGYVLDASGADVSRACFLSHDRDIFVNAEAEPYQIQGLVLRETKTKPVTEQQVIKNATATYNHVLAVVERIETAGIDIAPDYHDQNRQTGWLIVCFCLATLGGNGRELFHRVSQLSPKYDQAYTDEKFSEALDKRLFTTPAKFFLIAKEHGVDVSKPAKVKKGNAPITAEPGAVPALLPLDGAERPLPDQTPTEGKKRKHLMDNSDSVYYYIEEHKIRIKGGKNTFNTVAENFLIYVKYLTRDEYENMTWVLEIKPIDRDPIYVEVPHDDFTSASRLKKLITGKRYSLKISDSELSELHSYLFIRTEFSEATKITRYGYHAPSGVFFFANVAVDRQGNQREPDEFSMVRVTLEKATTYLSMPVNNKHKARRFTLTPFKLSLNQFYQTYAQAHGHENALIPFCFYMMSVFRDVAIGHRNFSPILYLKGGAGTGKSSMVRVLTAAFGRKQEGVNLKSKNTESALVKLMGQASNTIIWFDEFNNELGTTEGLLQAAYDNDGYHLSKAGTVGTNETDAMEIYSALALTSNYLPTNEIFFSRCVFVPINSADKTPDQRKAFDELELWQDEGLGCLTLELLSHRDLIEKEYVAAYDLLYGRIRAEFREEKVPERFFTNMAQLLSTALALATTKKIQITESTESRDILAELVEVGVRNIRRQYRIMSEKTALSVFFEIVQQLYDTFQIQEEVHFDYKKVGDTWWLRMNFPKIYNLYAQQYRRNNMAAAADRDGLQTALAALEGYADWESFQQQIRFRPSEESDSRQTTIGVRGSCTVNYSTLQEKFGLNLEGRGKKE